MFRRNLDGLPADAKAWLRKRAQPKWVAPMLATLTDEVFSRQGWLFEPKWDGECCVAFRRGRDLDLFSRNRIRLNAKYPEVVQSIHQQEATSLIADGEIVAFDGEITSFVEHRMTEGEDHCRQACQKRWEGIIAKNGDTV